MHLIAHPMLSAYRKPHNEGLKLMLSRKVFMFNLIFDGVLMCTRSHDLFLRIIVLLLEKLFEVGKLSNAARYK